MFVVTIDGPAGAGKSTVSRDLAQRFGWRLLDTGAMYRAVALAALQDQIDLQSDEALGRLVETLSVRLPPGQVLLDEVDVTSQIRSVEVTLATRHVADSPSVRRRLIGWQREFAEEYDVIAEGRDQGTIVFPKALCKFYMTANLEERARRRHDEFVARGESIPLSTVLNDLRERDDQDAARTISPMKPAPDATLVNTTGLSFDAVVDKLERLVRPRLRTAASVSG